MVQAEKRQTTTKHVPAFSLARQQGMALHLPLVITSNFSPVTEQENLQRHFQQQLQSHTGCACKVATA